MITFLVGADLFADYADGGAPLYLGLETGATLCALFGALVISRQVLNEFNGIRTALNQSRHAVDELLVERVELRAEAERWRGQTQELLKGLGEAIDQQFSRWRLSSAEREVGLLLLKGLSFKEIAKVRQTAEKTARQQARSVYKKSGLAGRAELSAFFLEDLLLPVASAER